MKKVLNDFREFIMKGNVIDLAVGIIIGGGFNTIVTSLVNDILMPPIGLLLGDVNFSDFYVILKQGETSVAAHATVPRNLRQLWMKEPRKKLARSASKRYP